MLSEIMESINNYFINPKQVEKGNFRIENGIINVGNDYFIGQYIRIIGSILNDGVYLVSDNILTLSGARDEAFNGIVVGLTVPQAFIKLAEEIEKYEKSSSGIQKGFTSISIGSFSGSRASNKDGIPLVWQETFRKDLDKYRRMFSEVII